jgi:uncharacterized membrane protein
MLSKIMYLILLTFTPFLELRASIPYGINILELPWAVVFFVCVLTNIILGPIVYILIDKFIHIFLNYKIFAKQYNRIITRTQKRMHKYIEKYGWIGLALFIAVPLPGSGSYSGALAADLVGLSFRKFVIANTLGVLIAGILVTLASQGFLTLF